MPRVNKVGHVVLNVKDVDESIQFYTDALGMELMSHNTERHMAFLSFGDQHHDIAVFKAPCRRRARRPWPEPHRHADRGR